MEYGKSTFTIHVECLYYLIDDIYGRVLLDNCMVHNSDYQFLKYD